MNSKTTWLQDLIFSKFKEALNRLKENHLKKQCKENCPYCNERNITSRI